MCGLGQRGGKMIKMFKPDLLEDEELYADVYAEFGKLPYSSSSKCPPSWPIMVTLMSFKNGEPLLDIRAFNPSPKEGKKVLGRDFGRFTEDQVLALYDILTPIVKKVKKLRKEKELAKKEPQVKKRGRPRKVQK
jgi:hypothetical protein